jgi:hypothetical protein
LTEGITALSLCPALMLVADWSVDNMNPEVTSYRMSLDASASLKNNNKTDQTSNFDILQKKVREVSCF